MINYNGNYLPSVTIGVPVLAVFSALLVIGIVISLLKSEDWEIFTLTGGLMIVALIATVTLSWIGYYPFKADYHKLQPVSGTVKTIDSRFLATSQYLVITYDTGLTVRCDDSRCATVREGDKLNLLCTKEHEFGSPIEADGWGCRWGKQ